MDNCPLQGSIKRGRGGIFGFSGFAPTHPDADTRADRQRLGFMLCGEVGVKVRRSLRRATRGGPDVPRDMCTSSSQGNSLWEKDTSFPLGLRYFRNNLGDVVRHAKRGARRMNFLGGLLRRPCVFTLRIILHLLLELSQCSDEKKNSTKSRKRAGKMKDYLKDAVKEESGKGDLMSADGYV